MKRNELEIGLLSACGLKLSMETRWKVKVATCLLHLAPFCLHFDLHFGQNGPKVIVVGSSRFQEQFSISISPQLDSLTVKMPPKLLLTLIYCN